MKTYFFVDSDGTENVSNYKPIRKDNLTFWTIDIDDNENENNTYDKITEIPHGTIKTLFGKELSYKEEPIIVEW